MPTRFVAGSWLEEENNRRSWSAPYTSPDFSSPGNFLGRAGRPRSTAPTVTHEIAKLLLEHADTFLQRSEAVQSALELGMPLIEIEEYLDWTETHSLPD